MIPFQRNAFIFILILVCAVSLRAQKWNLVWSDEFDVPGKPDNTKWEYETGYIANNELQYYTSRLENARVEDGMLVIEARKETYNGYNYTSARLKTQHTATWTYGRFEARAKLPKGRGMWPAFWMLGANIDNLGWPICGEIDIMENVGFEPNTIHGTIHTQAYNSMLGNQKTASILAAAPSDSFHVYAVEWFEDRIDFYLDSKKYLTFRDDGKGWSTWPFLADCFIILNSAVGGTWGGQKGVDDGIFPQKFYIDYVRVYEWDNTGVSQERPLPAESGYRLGQNYPNPFNAGTEITYQTPKDGAVRLDVFDTLGQPVRTLEAGTERAGEHKVIWNGLSDSGRNVPSGIYFLRLSDPNGGWTLNRKMLLAR